MLRLCALCVSAAKFSSSDLLKLRRSHPGRLRRQKGGKKAAQRGEKGVKKAAQWGQKGGAKEARVSTPSRSNQIPQLTTKEALMPDIKGTNRAQTLFLRSFRKSPTGPAPEDWPSITLLRRWLRKPAFRTALDSLREALRFHADFQLTIGASRAAQALSSPQDAALNTDDVRKLSELLRHSHLRQRFPTDPKLASPATFKLRDEIEDLEQSSKSLREERERK